MDILKAVIALHNDLMDGPDGASECQSQDQWLTERIAQVEDIRGAIIDLKHMLAGKENKPDT